MNIGTEQINVGAFAPRAGLADRIAAAEIAVEQVLKAFGVKFAINVITDGGKPVHQEIVLVDRKD